MPRLKSTVDVRRLTDGRLLILRGDLTGHDLELEGDAHWIRAFLDQLDGTGDAGAIHTAMIAGGFDADRDTVAAALAELSDAGLIEDATDDRELDSAYCERFSRQLAFFSDLASDELRPVQAQRRLQAAHVCVLGVGGLGSWAALGLACVGVGRLTLIDGDRLESSNLNRQILYSEADIGEHKALAATRRLRAFTSHSEVIPIVRRLRSSSEVSNVIEGCDMVIAAADSPPHQIDRWTNEACMQHGIPYLAISQQPPKVRVGPLYVPGETGCFACAEALYRQDYAHYDELVESAPSTSPAATFGPACGVVGTLAANEAVAYLAGLWPPATRGRSWILDLRTFEIEAADAARDGACLSCRSAAAATASNAQSR